MAPREGSRFVPTPSVYARAFGEELVLLDFGKGEYFGLDPIGAAIWRQVEAGADVKAILDHLVAAYDVERERAEADTVALLTHMCDASLLREV